MQITPMIPHSEFDVMKKAIFVTPADDLQQVFDTAQENTAVFLSEGDYRQKVMIRTPGLTLVGAGADRTRLIFDDYALKLDEQGREYNTFRTYTLAVCADHVTIRQLSVVNDALQPEIKGQEVALSIVADDFLMEDCRLTSTQDTLFLGPLPPDLILRYQGFHRQELLRGGIMRQQFRNCLIEGTVDFIFGCGDALFECCQIRSLVDARKIGYVAAPAHSSSQERGFLFRDCCLTREAGVGDGTIYLARPWRDYGMVSFWGCRMEAHIAPEGFDKWNDTDRDKTARFSEYPPVPGRVPWANRREAST